MTAPVKMSLRSPAIMWVAPATLTYSAWGQTSRKLRAPSSDTTSDNPPRTRRVGRDSRAAHDSSRAAVLFGWRLAVRKAGSQCQ